MSTPKNIKEFQALVKRYETITLEEIENAWGKYSDGVARKLTGFGLYSTCTLCLAVERTWQNDACSDCVYGEYLGCTRKNNLNTYYAFLELETPEQLLTAFRNRAEHLRKTYPQYI